MIFKDFSQPVNSLGPGGTRQTIRHILYHLHRLDDLAGLPYSTLGDYLDRRQLLDRAGRNQ